MVLAGVALGPPGGGPPQAKQNAAMLTSRAIGECLYQYSVDHNGHYPEGKTATEVFQQLIDQKYVTDPELFYVGYIRIPGKMRPQGLRLKAENVCFDVTCCVDGSSSDELPVVFLTGFKIYYKANAPAIHIGRFEPPIERTWSEWWNGRTDYQPRGIAVWYKNNNAMWKRANEDGSIPNFIPADFDPKGKTYQQLTP